MPADWLPELLRGLDAGQRGLLQALHALGAVATVHGQPAWPWGHRLAIEVLAIDRALARQFALSAGAVLLALLLLGLGGRWRRGRRGAWALAVLLLLAAPWPSPGLVFTAAVPTSFHRSPTGFHVGSIAEGRQHFLRHCAGCHGDDGRGEGPRAAGLAMWPPDLTGGLLWRRREGELLWRVLHGTQDHRGRASMPGFAATLSDAQAWTVMDHLHALASGTTLARRGAWEQPVPLPDALVRCDGAPARSLLRGWPRQRVRLVAVGAPGGVVQEDPRLVTVALTPSAGVAGLQADCRLASDDAWNAFAQLAGVPPQALAGTQFIADRQGWLRARAQPGQGGWSAADLVCRSGDAATRPEAPPHRPPGGLEGLIAQMDAQAVQYVRGGVAH